MLKEIRRRKRKKKKKPKPQHVASKKKSEVKQTRSLEEKRKLLKAHCRCVLDLTEHKRI